MNVAILFDDVAARAEASPDERGVLASVDAVEAALRSASHDPTRVAISAPGGRWIERIERAAPDVVFNLCEGAAGVSAHEPRVAAVVELLGVPMTGSGAEALALARRKDRTNAILAAAGLRVPPWRVWRAGEEPPGGVAYPAIVKPAGEDGSVAVGQASVVTDDAALRDAIGAAGSHAPLLVQAFVGSRELAVGFVGERVLPVTEMDFSTMPPGRRPIVTYDAKWAAGSVDDRGARPICPAQIPDGLHARLIRDARVAWDAVGGRGYGRVDFRLDDEGHVWVLEVNPNPDLDPEAGLARMARSAGLDYRALVELVLAEAA